MILFMNKFDLYAAKVKHVNIGSIKSFSDYNALGYPPNDYEAGITYFKDKFISMCTNPNKEVRCCCRLHISIDNFKRGFTNAGSFCCSDCARIYWHVTCATDTAQFLVIFNSCRENKNG